MPAQPCQQPRQGFVSFQVPLSCGLGMLRISAWTFSVRASPGETSRALEERERALGDQREAGDEDRAGDEHVLLAQGEPVDDVAAECPATDERREGGRGDDLDGRDPYAGNDRRGGDRQLDPAQELVLAHPHGAARLDHVAVDLAESRRRCW